MRLRHLGMEVLGYDPYISVDAAWNLSPATSRHVTDVDDIYEECDYITIHVPLMDSTKKMINAEAISRDEGRRDFVELCKRSAGG